MSFCLRQTIRSLWPTASAASFKSMRPSWTNKSASKSKTGIASSPTWSKLSLEKSSRSVSASRHWKTSSFTAPATSFGVRQRSQKQLKEIRRNRERNTNRVYLQSALSTPQQPNRRVWCANLCCAFKREHGHGSVFYPHRSESWRKRTIVWSIQLRQSDRTDNKSGSNAARSELWRAVRGSAAERGHHLHAHRVPALSLVDVIEFYADDAFVCDPEPH